MSTLLLVMLVPGALVVLAAYLLARVIGERMQLEQGTHSHRLVRAVATVRLREVWSQARRWV